MENRGTIPSALLWPLLAVPSHLWHFPAKPTANHEAAWAAERAKRLKNEEENELLEPLSLIHI
eukprot:2834284-Pyramimonas_sp.AAC.1